MTELEKQWMRAGLGDDLGPSGDLAGYLTTRRESRARKGALGKGRQAQGPRRGRRARVTAELPLFSVYSVSLY